MSINATVGINFHIQIILVNLWCLFMSKRILIRCTCTLFSILGFFALSQYLNLMSKCYFSLKVETIGDAYMVVSGAPDKTRYHALHICDMSLDMLDAMNELRDPSTDGNMKIRVGRLHVLQTLF